MATINNAQQVYNYKTSYIPAVRAEELAETTSEGAFLPSNAGGLGGSTIDEKKPLKPPRDGVYTIGQVIKENLLIQYEAEANRARQRKERNI